MNREKNVKAELVTWLMLFGLLFAGCAAALYGVMVEPMNFGLILVGVVMFLTNSEIAWFFYHPPHFLKWPPKKLSAMIILDALMGLFLICVVFLGVVMPWLLAFTVLLTGLSLCAFAGLSIDWCLEVRKASRDSYPQMAPE